MPSKKRKGATNTVGCSSNTIWTSDAKRKKLDLEDEVKASNKTEKDTKKTKGTSKLDEKRIRVSQRTSSVSSPHMKKKKPERKGKLDTEDKKRSPVVAEKILQSPASKSSSKAKKLEPARMKHIKRYSKQSDLGFVEGKKRKSLEQEHSTDQGENIQRNKSRKKKKNLKRKNKVKQSSSSETNLRRVGQAFEEGISAEEVEHVSSDEQSGSFSYEGRTLSDNLKSMSCSTDLQTWPEVPSIAHFCSLFRQAFDLLEFDIQELEESLLLMGTEDDTTQLVLRLVIKLLVGCSRTFTRNITEDNYNTYLRRLFLTKQEEAEEDHLEYSFRCDALLDDGTDYGDLSLRHRVTILHQLCEFRLEADDVCEKVKNLDASSLRVEPLGVDSTGITYWYFYGTRLYREAPKAAADRKKKDREKKRKKREKKRKKKKSRHHSISSADEDDYSVTSCISPKSSWSVACLTLQDWEKLTEKYKNSKAKMDRELFETLSESFLPEIVKMFAEKEREERRRMLMLQPKRASSRIERKKMEQEDRDRILAIKLEEERHLEEEYDIKLREERQQEDEVARERSREERIKQRDLMKAEREHRAVERELGRKLLRHSDVGNDEDYALYQKIEVEDDASKERSNKYEPPLKLSNVKEESDDSEEDESYQPSMEKLTGSASSTICNKKGKSGGSFANALLRVGTKSTKDSTLDKPVQRKPGRLLETAGRSLLQKRASITAATSSSSSTSTKSGGSSVIATNNTIFNSLSISSNKLSLSFGLYGGHLSVDHGGPLKQISTISEGPKDESCSTQNAGSFTRSIVSTPKLLQVPQDDENGAIVEKSVEKRQSCFTKKVFSNWGGEFFKKNLDYRANTNKILEKMNLTKEKQLSITSPLKSSETISSGGERMKDILGSGSNLVSK